VGATLSGSESAVGLDVRRDVLVEVTASKLREGDWVESRSETETEPGSWRLVASVGSASLEAACRRRGRSQAQKALKQRRIGKRVAPKKYGFG
jgi:hypothetical protein